MIKFYYEKLDNNLKNELLKIIEVSKEEVYGNKKNKALYNSLNENYNDLNWQHYLALQEKGLLVLATMRDDGKLVGYYAASCYYHNQSKGLFCAYVEHVHVLKEYRKDKNAIKLINFAEEKLKKLGVKSMTWGINPKLGTDKLLNYLGWSVDEVIFSKELI